MRGGHTRCLGDARFVLAADRQAAAGGQAGCCRHQLLLLLPLQLHQPSLRLLHALRLRLALLLHSAIKGGAGKRQAGKSGLAGAHAWVVQE